MFEIRLKIKKKPSYKKAVISFTTITFIIANLNIISYSYNIYVINKNEVILSLIAVSDCAKSDLVIGYCLTA